MSKRNIEVTSPLQMDPTNPRPFPYDRGNMPIEQYLLRLLIGFVVQSGGELRLDAHKVLNIDPKSVLVRTVDSQRGEIVLRFGSKHSEMYVIPDETSVNRQEAAEILQWSPRTTREIIENPETLDHLDHLDARPQPPDENLLELKRSWRPSPKYKADEIPDLTQVSTRHQVLDDMRTFMIESRNREVKEREQAAREMIQKNRTANLPYRNSPSGKP